MSDYAPGPEAEFWLRWATPSEVEEALSGPGVVGAVWIPHPEVDGFFDLAVPRASVGNNEKGATQ